jgi:ATP-binding protein involved in chromosome partitioning
MDPRIKGITKRLEGINKVIAVSGGKGGVGKSSFAAVLALALSEAGHKVGLIDLDFWGPCAHIMLGVQPREFPEENKGIVPPEVGGIKFMSIVYYTEDKDLALRRVDYEQAVIELLAVTQWGPLDYLIMDMPPGIGDVMLDVIQVIKRVEFCIVATDSRLVMETVKKTIKMLKQLELPILGVVQNMKEKDLSIMEQIEIQDVPYIGEVDLDLGLEHAVGDPEKLLQTMFAKDIHDLLKRAGIIVDKQL